MSPLADGGYDVADYRAIDPAFGTLEEAEALIADALALGIRTIIDIVPNHVSDRHPWFQAALAGGPGLARSATASGSAPAAAPDGDEPPTGWRSEFQGVALDPHDRTRRHARRLVPPPVHAEQPDLNWDHPDVRAEHEAILRFWFDRGVAGVRIDSAALLVKDAGAARGPGRPGPGRHPHPGPRRAARHLPRLARDRRLVPGTRVLVGEVWLRRRRPVRRYLRPDELHTAFNFDFMARPWEAADLRDSIDATLAAHAPVGAPATWVLSNHDVTRPVTRYGRDGHLVRVPPQAVRGSRRTSSSDGAGHARPPCSPPPCPARSTSTRATSSGSTRSRSRPTRSRTRCTAAPAASTRSRRLPRAAALERRRAAVRLQPGRRDRPSRG